MHKDCFQCNINQMKKISQFLGLDHQTNERLIAITNDYQNHCDMTQTNPETMGEIWERIIPIIKTDNPYQHIKKHYNHILLSMENELQDKMNAHDLNYALKLAITGNLIDFAAKHKFDESVLMDMLKRVSSTQLAIDDSADLFDKVQNSSFLLYLGDNCGEIVLDKCFISRLKQVNPCLKVYYGVRGKPIVNDVTSDDAYEVKMDEVATIVSSGARTLGTVLHRTSQEFQDIFHQVDLVICKGQGNYEGLMGNEKEYIYFLFMAKCDLVANQIGVDKMSIVCMKNR